MDVKSVFDFVKEIIGQDMGIFLTVIFILIGIYLVWTNKTFLWLRGDMGIGVMAIGLMFLGMTLKLLPIALVVIVLMLLVMLMIAISNNKKTKKQLEYLIRVKNDAGFNNTGKFMGFIEMDGVLWEGTLSYQNPICLNCLEPVSSGDVQYCKKCNKTFHSGFFYEWKKSVDEK